MHCTADLADNDESSHHQHEGVLLHQDAFADYHGMNEIFAAYRPVPFVSAWLSMQQPEL